MNTKLSDYTNCEKLQLSDIKYVEKKESHEKEILGKIKNFLTFVIIFVTSPGDAIYEATVKRIHFTKESKNVTFSLLGPISRLNTYENQSNCVNDSTIQLYCYCKIQV